MWTRKFECGSRRCIQQCHGPHRTFSIYNELPDLDIAKAKKKLPRVEKGVIIKTQEELRYMPKEIINACFVLREPGSPVQLSYSRKETRGEKKSKKSNHGRLCLSLPNADNHMS